MQPVRVLVVDDAVVARRVISEILSEEDGLEVVGTAPNGKIALAKIERQRPDLVTLDIDMPELDGMETLSRIRSDYPELDPPEWHKWVTIKQVDGEVAVGERPLDFWGDLRENYETHCGL